MVEAPEPPFLVRGERCGRPVTLGKVVRLARTGRLALAVPYGERTRLDVVSVPVEAVELAQRAGAGILAVKPLDGTGRMWVCPLADVPRRGRLFAGEFWLRWADLDLERAEPWPYVEGPAVTLTWRGDQATDGRFLRKVEKLFRPAAPPRPRPTKPVPPEQAVLF